MTTGPLVAATLLALTASCAVGGDGDSRVRNTEGTHDATESPLAKTGTTLVAGTYEQLIDRAGSSTATFTQRYWVDTHYAKSASAPVIYHICGEGDCSEDYFLHDNAINWASSLGANLVYLEHRYYGQSLPFSDLSDSHLADLTLDNEMADLAAFQAYISEQKGFTGKWLVVGGSYSGTISALYRFIHPELVVGSLAASAPMISGTATDEGTQDDVDELSSTDPSGDTGERQWVYEACTKFGFWEADGAEAGATIFQPSAWLCQQLFGADVQMFDGTAYNAAYSTPFITAGTDDAPAPSNILFTYGTADVWTAIGLTAASNHNPGITISSIAGAGHHFDLNYPTSSDSTAVKAARTEFLTLAKQWLAE